MAENRARSRGLSGLRPNAARRIGHRRIAGLMLVVLAVLATGAALLIQQSENSRRTGIVLRFDARHITASRFIDAYLNQELEQVGSMAASTMNGPVSQTRLDEITQENEFSSSVLMDLTGKVLAISPANPSLIGTRSIVDDSALRSALGGLAAVVTTQLPGQRLPVVEFAVPFETPHQNRVFAGGYPVGNTPLEPFVANALSTYKTAHVYVIDSAGTVISADLSSAAGRSLHQVSAPLTQAIKGRSSGFFGSGKDRQHYVAGPIVGAPWRLVFTVDRSELYASYTRAERWTPWGALIGFVLMGLGIIALVIAALAGRTRAEDDHARQEAILDTTSDAFIGMDEQGLVIDWNTAAARLLGWTREEALGQPVSTLMISPRDRPAHSSALREFLVTGVAKLPRHPVNLTAQHRDGHEIPVELTVSRTEWQGIWRFHAFMRDITERLEHEKQLQEMALTDPLTGLANRRAFLDNLDQAHARARRHHGRLAVLYADVDQFKSINDTFGHAAGDAILTQIADRLREHFRTEDTIGRLGGDEFAVVCEDFTSQPQALAERLRKVLAVPYSFRGQPILATVSVGLASPVGDETTEHLLERADSVMYRAKAAHHTP